MPIVGHIDLVLKKAVAAVASMQGDPGLTVSPAIAMSRRSHSSGLAQNLKNNIIKLLIYYYFHSLFFYFAFSIN